MEVIGYVSLNEIIESIHRDLALNEEIPMDNSLSWAVEAMDLIGSPMSYIKRVTGESPSNPTVKIEDFKGKLPCDLFQIEHIRDACNKTTIAKSTDNYHMNSRYNTPLDISCNYKFDIRDGYIYTNFEEGELEIAYLAYPIDKECMLLIPDITRVKMAVSAYIKYMLYERKWLNGEIDERRFSHMKSEWAWRVGSANTKLNIPSKHMMNNIVNRWVSMIPIINEYGNGFRNTGEQETRYNY